MSKIVIKGVAATIPAQRSGLRATLTAVSVGLHIMGSMPPKNDTLTALMSTRIELLISALGTATRVADFLGVTRPLLSKWRAGTTVPSPTQARLVVDLDYVVARGSLIYPPQVIGDWLVGHDPYLEGARPIDVLHLRGISEVLAALASLEQRAWGG